MELVRLVSDIRISHFADIRNKIADICN